VNQVSDGLKNRNIELFFPETTTYTNVYGHMTTPKLISESKCPRRMTLTQSGRLCYVFVMDLTFIYLVEMNETESFILVRSAVVILGPAYG